MNAFILKYECIHYLEVIMYGIEKKSNKSKLFILFIQLVYLVVDLNILNKGEFHPNVYFALWFALVLTFIRLNLMMFVWLPRGISWKEAIGNSCAFGIYYIGFPLFALYSSTYSPVVLFIGYALFVIGSLINTMSELLRKPFKDDPSNKGKLYTGGLFKYSIHINYFGDILWVLGFALLTMNVYAILVPIGLTLLFTLSYIPNADNYLRKNMAKHL